MGRYDRMSLLLLPVLVCVEVVLAGLDPREPCKMEVNGTPVDYLDDSVHYTNSNCQQLDRNVALAWTIDISKMPVTMRFEVHGTTEGWMSVGINNKLSMLGADVAVGWVNDDGTSHLYDAWTDPWARKPPTKDDHQDVILHKARERRGVTSFLYERALATGDSDDRDIQERVWIIWAYGTEDPEDNNLEYLGYHILDGATSIQFTWPSDETTAQRQPGDEL